jgi:hypothetical protein
MQGGVLVLRMQWPFDWCSSAATALVTSSASSQLTAVCLYVQQYRDVW